MSTAIDTQIPKVEYGARYIVHVEDEPLFLRREFNRIDEAVASLQSSVLERLQKNGCGDGLIYDRKSNRIIALAAPIRPGFDSVDTEFLFNDVVRSSLEPRFIPWLDWSADEEEYPHFVWPTMFG